MGPLKRLRNGKIATSSKPYFKEAVAIADGKIAVVGKNPELLHWKTPETEIWNLEGARSFLV